MKCEADSCEQICEVEYDEIVCSCRHGFELRSDRKTCAGKLPHNKIEK